MAKEKAKEREKRSKREERKVKRKQSRVSVLETHLKTARAHVRRRPPCTCTYDEGAVAYLENGVGTTFPLVVDEVVSKQLFKAHTAELLPADDYKLVVKSRAGDAAGPLQTSFRRVKYLRVVDPEPVPVAQSLDGKVKIFSVTEDGQGESFTPGRDWLISGSGLVGNGWEVLSARLLYTRRLDGEFGTVTVAPDGRSAAFNIARDNLPDADENLFSLEINLVREGSGSTEGDEHLIIDGITLNGWPYYDG